MGAHNLGVISITYSRDNGSSRWYKYTYGGMVSVQKKSCKVQVLLLSQKVNEYFILLRFVFLLIGLWKTCLQRSGFAENMKREK